MIKKLLQQAGTIGAGVAILMVVLAFLFGFNRVDEYEVGVKFRQIQQLIYKSQ